MDPVTHRIVLETLWASGANTTIDRGSHVNTVIGSGTKIDNLVQIGHNVQIGENCMIAAQCGIGGSAVLGQYVFIGAQTGIHQHRRIGDHAKIAAKSGVMTDVPSGATFGTQSVILDLMSNVDDILVLTVPFCVPCFRTRWLPSDSYQRLSQANHLIAKSGARPKALKKVRVNAAC